VIAIVIVTVGVIVIVMADATEDAAVVVLNVESVAILLETADTDVVQVEIAQTETEVVIVIVGEIDVTREVIHVKNVIPVHIPEVHQEATQSIQKFQNAIVIHQLDVIRDQEQDRQDEDILGLQEEEILDLQETTVLTQSHQEMVVPVIHTHLTAELAVHQATARTVLMATVMDIQMVA